MYAGEHLQVSNRNGQEQKTETAVGQQKTGKRRLVWWVLISSVTLRRQDEIRRKQHVGIDPSCFILIPIVHLWGDQRMSGLASCTCSRQICKTVMWKWTKISKECFQRFAESMLQSSVTYSSKSHKLYLRDILYILTVISTSMGADIGWHWAELLGLWLSLTLWPA